ncbi:hypothetical protein B0H19DRAFT_1201853 [Mycena capillaripes]|nr:hypothetical protein B0H19DRAFT_1201853 [Mycena capillaripes]
MRLVLRGTSRGVLVGERHAHGLQCSSRHRPHNPHRSARRRDPLAQHGPPTPRFGGPSAVRARPGLGRR